MPRFLNTLCRQQTIEKQILFLWILFASVAGATVAQDVERADFQRGPDTQPETSPFLNDTEAVDAWKVPPGFEISLFASSPKIAQPIAGTFDRFGRMWLAENYTYAELPQRFDRNLSDRIVILEDRTDDGSADTVQVFYDQAKLLASVEVGMGGVWILAAPQLLFIPDADLDGRPDGPPRVILDGFDDSEIGHNLVNGLRWGPDGWLYGRHGIQATSYVGRPETPSEKRTRLNCCIWRYHPVREKFEVVCYGTTNSWGHDWDQHGQLFFINTVIGHLWHAIPGLHTERMYGEDLRPYLFHLTSQVADHFHWDQSVEAWTQQRDGMTSGTDAAGGGHAHSGLTFYHGYRWPQDFHGDVLTLNFHGRRVNRDRIEPLGATYTAKHHPDPFKTADTWFRGIDLFCGPDDAVYALDWSDLGECHENDGIHRSSGRIYRIDHPAKATNILEQKSERSPPTKQQVVLLLQGDDLDAMAELLQDRRPWVWRQARLRLQEHASGMGRQDEHLAEDLAQASIKIWAAFQAADTSDLRYRLLSGWWAVGVGSVDELTSLLEHEDPHVRCWGIRFLTDHDAMGSQRQWSGTNLNELGMETVRMLIQLAEHESHGLVLTYLASSMRLMSPADRWSMGRRLVRHQEFATDRIFPYLLWYGLEPSVTSHAHRVDELLTESRINIIDRFVARRLAIEYTIQADSADLLNSLMEQLLSAEVSAEKRREVLEGLREGWQGWSDLPVPALWSNVAKMTVPDDQQSRYVALTNQVEAVFQSSKSLAQQLEILSNEQENLELRRSMMLAIVKSLNQASQQSETNWNAECDQAVEQLKKLLGHRFLATAAANALERWNDPRATELLLAGISNSNDAGREAIVKVLCTRTDAATDLLQAIHEGEVSRDLISPHQIRQLQLLESEVVKNLLGQIWPERDRQLGQSQLEQISTLQAMLTEEDVAAGDKTRGRILFQQNCGKCHRLFGEGERLGPDLTGAQRDNLNYWLQNIVAPSAEVSSEFRLSAVLLNDGRTLSGVVTQQTPASFVLVTQEGTQLIRVSEVEEVRPLNQSLMPDGLLTALSDQDKLHLFAYLMSREGP